MFGGKININKFIDIEYIKNQHGIEEYKFNATDIGYDDKVYILFYKSSEDNIEKYVVIAIEIDWDTYEIAYSEKYDIGSINNAESQEGRNIQFIQPIGEDILLAKSRVDVSTNDNNVYIVDKCGNIKNEFCVGDGVEKCIVTRDGKIIVGYFDEGICGTLEEALVGSAGIVVWDPDGNQFWKNTRNNIIDCYAMNVDSRGNLWFYYYSDFVLIQTNFKQEKKFNVGVSGAHFFLLDEIKDRVLFDGGYRDDNLYWTDLKPGKLKKKKVALTIDKNHLSMYSTEYRENKLLIYDLKDKIWIYKC